MENCLEFLNVFRISVTSTESYARGGHQKMHFVQDFRYSHGILRMGRWAKNAFCLRIQSQTRNAQGGGRKMHFWGFQLQPQNMFLLFVLSSRERKASQVAVWPRAGMFHFSLFPLFFLFSFFIFFSRACAWRGNPKRPRLLGRKLTIKNAHHVAGHLTIENHGLLDPKSLRLRVWHLGKFIERHPWNQSLPRNNIIVISFGTAYVLALILVLCPSLRRTA